MKTDTTTMTNLTRLYLVFISCCLSISLFGQAFEECDDAFNSPVSIGTIPFSTTITIDPAWTNDTDYNPDFLGDNTSVAYWAFTVNNSSYYDLSFSTNSSNPTISSVSIGLGESCPLVGNDEIFFNNLGVDSDVSAGCFNFQVGQTYVLVFAVEESNEGDVNITISDASPSNDDCNLGSNPEILFVTSGSTSCADFETSTCAISDPNSDHQVFYQYTNTSGSNTDLEITLEPDASGSNNATQVSVTVFEDDCSLLSPFYSSLSDSEWCDILGSGSQTIPCIEDGETIILLFSSEDGEEGDFTISVFENSFSPVDGNDECFQALDITPINTCEWTTITVDNNFACTEDFFIDGCNYDIDPTVWYSFTVPPATGDYRLEIQDITDPFSYLTVFESFDDCDAPPGPISSGCEMGPGPHDQFDDLIPGQTYLIAFANSVEGTFSFDLKINLLPENDECFNATPLSPFISFPGTTSCATQEIIPFISGTCANPDNESNTVWYEVNVLPGEKGFNLTLNSSAVNPITGDINIVVFETTISGCVADASTFVDDVCLLPSEMTDQFECIGEGTYLIRVATSDLNAGDFDILFEPFFLGQPNDNCDSPDISLDVGLECEWISATALTVDACPESEFIDPGFCGLSFGSVVWYEATAPVSASFLDLQILTDGGSNPFIAIFPGNPIDCDILSFVVGSTCYEGIFNNLDELGEPQINIVPGSTYLIAVGVTDPFGAALDFGIKWISPPVNDECFEAIALTGGIVQNGTTSCATQSIGGWYNSSSCTDADEENTVWYTYDVPETDKGFNITVNATAIEGFSGDLNIVLFEPDPIGSCDVSGMTVVD